ncbi:MAG: YbjN domain-containing protein [Candidatus Brocadiaceae bacterium]|jgi:hypothetical protein
MEEEQIKGLIDRLRNFRTRSQARRRLVALGPEAVGPLLAALEEESNEGAKWTILNCLGELGADRAVPVIAPYLEKADYQTVAHDALVKITGRDLGLVPRAWLRGLAEEEAARPPSEGELSDERLLELSLEGSGAEWNDRGEGRCLVELPIAEGRRREVTVCFGAEDHEGSPIAIVYADCGEAHPEDYETVLRNNMRMPYGAVALRDVGGQPYFVMFNTILRKGLSPTELRKSIMTVGERAERVQRQLCD